MLTVAALFVDERKPQAIDKVAAGIAVRFPCTYAHAKYVLNLAREFDADNAEKITNKVIAYESMTMSSSVLLLLEQLVREKTSLLDLARKAGGSNV